MKAIRLGRCIAVCLGFVLVSSSAAFGDFFTFTTPSGSTDTVGDPVSASVDFNVGVNTISITLTDLLANPKDAGQLLSDLTFDISDGITSTASLTGSSGMERTVNSNGTFTDGASVATGWVLSSPSAGTLHLDVLSGPGHAGPAHLIIGGPGAGGAYLAANGSIAGNGPHNPFLNGSATFTIDLSGVDADSAISNVFFSFGTTAGDNVPGIGGVTSNGVPDRGMSLVLLGISFAVVATSHRVLSCRTMRRV